MYIFRLKNLKTFFFLFFSMKTSFFLPFLLLFSKFGRGSTGHVASWIVVLSRNCFRQYRNLLTSVFWAHFALFTEVHTRKGYFTLTSNVPYISLFYFILGRLAIESEFTLTLDNENWHSSWRNGDANVYPCNWVFLCVIPIHAVVLSGPLISLRHH